MKWRTVLKKKSFLEEEEEKKPYIFITPKVFKVFDEDDIFMFSCLEVFQWHFSKNLLIE